MKRRFFVIVVAVMMLLGAFAMNAAATDELADVYVATTGVDTNAGTTDAPVLSLNKALELVANGGTVHIVDSFTAPAGFVWDNHNKDVTISGGKLDLSAGYIEDTDGGSAFYYYAQGDAVTYDNLELVLADDMYYFANGFRLQVNENVTVVGKDLQLYGGAFKKAVAGTNMKLLGGSYLCDDGYASIYGGSYKADVNGDVNLYIGRINPDYTISHYGMTRLYGGCYNYSGNSYVRGNVNLTIAGGNIDRIVSVSHTACIITGDVNTQMTGGSTYSLIGGSGGEGNVQGDIRLTMTGGTAAQVFGANEGGSYTGNVTVKLQGGTITRRFFGGCYNNYGGEFDSQNHVTGNVDVYIHEDMNFAWNTLESDAGFFAHSRYTPLFDDEVTSIYFMSAAAQTKHEGNLGAKNAGMRMVMGDSTAVADNVSVISADVEKWNVILGDDIGANFYVKLPDIAPESAMIKVTVADRVESHDLFKLTADAEGLYLIPVNVAAAWMTEPISLQLVLDGQEGQAVSYTIAQYADTILNGDYTDKAKDMVRYMLHYGAAAQEYFGINTNNLANAGHELEYAAQFPTEYPQLAVEGSIDGVRFYGASLCMDNLIAVRYYFVADSVEGVTFTVKDKNITTGQKNDMFYVEVAGINPYEYANAMVLSAVKGEECMEVTYSPLTYMVRMSSKGSEKMKALVNALYGYHEAALAYLDSRSAYIELPSVTGGSVEADKLSCIAGETVSLTVKPEQYYNLTNLTVKKDGEVFAIFETATNGGTYSFATGAAGVYTVEATLVPDHMISAPNADIVLRSPSIKYAEGNAFLERGVADGVNADDPMIDTLLTQAPGEFNKSGEEWLWIAYKISVPAHGTYSLGLTINDARDSAYKMPMVINHEVYTLNFTAKKQTVTTDVTLPAGEHIITVFWPMPATASAALAYDWENYIWANVQTVVVDYAMSVCSAPTAEEVEEAVRPMQVISAADDTQILWSAAVGSKTENGTDILWCEKHAAIREDKPVIDTLVSDAFDQFNTSGSEWTWFAYNVTASKDGTYTLGVKVNNCNDAAYKLPVYVDGQVYALNFTAKKQAVTTEVVLPAGTHTVVMFMPMPATESGITGNNSTDYPWCNVESVIVDPSLTVAKPETADVEDSFYTKLNGGDETVVLFNNFTDNGDTLGSISAGNIRADMPIVNMLPYASNYLSRWPYASVKVTAEKSGTYQILVNAGVNTGTKSAQLGMLVDGTAYSVPFEKVSPTKMKTAVNLTAGEHVITFFLPMPTDYTAAIDNSYYPWMDYNSILFEHGISEISKPTVEEIQANMLSYVPATDSCILPSATMSSTKDKNVSILSCANQSFVRADLPYIDSLVEDAYGQFNNSGEEWNWFAFKVSAPETGKYALGVMTQNAKFANYKIPMFVNDQVYTLNFTATSQAMTAEVALPAGEHVVVVFAPMRQNAESAEGNVYNDYIFANFRAVVVDSELTVSLPTVTEVENCFLPDVVIPAVDAQQILHSATLNVTETYLGRTDQSTLGVDQPTIETLYTDAAVEFNQPGEEWNWFAYKINVPYDGVYTLGAKTVNAKFANYLIPLCVNGEAYTLKYTAKAQEVTTRVTLPAGEHTVVMFMPMRATKANIEGNASNDYCWCDVESVIVDGELTVSVPTVEEVKAVFAPQTLSAVNTDYMVWSKYIKVVGSQLERSDNAGRANMYNDGVYIDNLLTVAPGEFNKSGEEWVWFAYQVTAPEAGSYCLGLSVKDCGQLTYQIPMYVNGAVYTLSYSAKNQDRAVTVDLPAGEHTVVVFMPMPGNAESASGTEWVDYTWVCTDSIIVDNVLTVGAPTVEEVEACFPVQEEEVPEEGGLENGGTLVDDYVYGDIS